jgi:hypothetical protein
MHYVGDKEMRLLVFMRVTVDETNLSRIGRGREKEHSPSTAFVESNGDGTEDPSLQMGTDTPARGPEQEPRVRALAE